MSADDTMMTVATFDTLMEAELARSYLEGEGIRCFLADAEMVNTAWYLSGAMGGIKLQVAKADFLTAERLLNSRPKGALTGLDDYGLRRPTEHVTAEPEHVRQPAVSPEDEYEPPETQAEALVRGALRSAIIGLFLCPPCLHVYSLYLLSEAHERWQELGEDARRSFWFAAALDGVVIVVGVLLAAWIVIANVARG
jgi:hypothetical protein